MPDLKWNTTTWNGSYDWLDAGEEWSQAWGGSEAQWFGSLFPRLHRFLPAQRILEIAPGYGRWTKFLVGNGTSYVGVDLSAQCVEACKQRFSSVPMTEFLLNDGVSLSGVAGTFDLVFSFDSLVHAEQDILKEYIAQISSKLTPTGAAFVHHSNFLNCKGFNAHQRASSVDAGLVADLVRQNGGCVLIQEKVNWGDKTNGGVEELTDCFTLFANSSQNHGAASVIENYQFMDEARIIRQGQSIYSDRR